MDSIQAFWNRVSRTPCVIGNWGFATIEFYSDFQILSILQIRSSKTSSAIYTRGKNYCSVIGIRLIRSDVVHIRDERMNRVYSDRCSVQHSGAGWADRWRHWSGKRYSWLRQQLTSARMDAVELTSACIETVTSRIRALCERRPTVESRVLKLSRRKIHYTAPSEWNTARPITWSCLFLIVASKIIMFRGDCRDVKSQISKEW